MENLFLRPRRYPTLFCQTPRVVDDRLWVRNAPKAANHTESLTTAQSCSCISKDTVYTISSFFY